MNTAPVPTKGPLGNDSCDECEIGIALRAAKRSLEALQGLREDMKHVPLWYRCCDRFAELYHVARLWKEVRDLIAILKTTSCTTDPMLSISVGEFLYKIERFEEAAACFGKAVEILNVPDQDIRLRALMGKLESKIAYQQCLWLCGKTDSKKQQETEILHELIAQDLYAVTEPLQHSIKSRLCRAKLNMDVLATRIKVSRDAEMLKRCRFGQPD